MWGLYTELVDVRPHVTPYQNELVVVVIVELGYWLGAEKMTYEVKGFMLVRQYNPSKFRLVGFGLAASSECLP